MAKEEFDPRIREANDGDVASAKDLLAELGYALRVREWPSTEICNYFAEKIQKILVYGHDARRALNLVEDEGRPPVSAEKAHAIVNGILDRLDRRMSLPDACNAMEYEDGYTEITKKGKKKSLTAARYREIWDEWSPRLCPARANKAEQKTKSKAVSRKNKKSQD